NLESLVKCGAFDSLHLSRAETFVSIEHALNASAAAHRDRVSGQVSLFAEELNTPVARKINVEPWAKQEMLSHEKELLGFYVTGHPLDDYLGSIESGKFTMISEAKEFKERKPAKFAGLLLSVEKKFTKSEGKPFAVLTLEDFTGSLELTVWSEVLSKYGSFLEV